MWIVPRMGRPTVPGWASHSWLPTETKSVPSVPRWAQPLRAPDVDEAVSLGARVVLVDDGPPPLDHLPLDVDRARRGGVDDRLEARHVVRPADFLGELEHPDEHRRH